MRVLAALSLPLLAGAVDLELSASSLDSAGSNALRGGQVLGAHAEAEESMGWTPKRVYAAIEREINNLGAK